MTLRFRILTVIGLLTMMILVAGYSSIPEDNAARSVAREHNPGDSDWFKEIFNRLDDIEIAHIVIHIVTFGTVAFLLGPWGTPPERGSIRLVYTTIIVVTIIWEAVQAGVFVGLGGLGDNHFFNAPWVSRVILDFIVNLTAGTVVLTLIYLFSQQIEKAVNVFSN